MIQQEQEFSGCCDYENTIEKEGLDVEAFCLEICSSDDTATGILIFK
jgi:hypothetical protein